MLLRKPISEQSINLLLLSSIAVLYVHLGPESFWSFALCGTVHMLIMKKCRKDKQLAADLYLVFTGIALVYCCIYRYSYGNTLGWAGDDSVYLRKINELIAYGSAATQRYTLFEFVLYLIYGKMLFLNEVLHLDVLPVICLLSSLVIHQVVQFADELLPSAVHKANASLFSLPILFLALHPKFIDISCHLYRDAMTLLLQLMSMRYALKRRYICALSVAVITGYVRGGNGALAMVFMLFLMCSGLFTSVKTGARVIICLVILMLFGLGLYLDSIYKFGTYTRSFKGERTDRITITERTERRNEYAESQRQNAYGGKLVYFGYMFSPFVLDSVMTHREIHQADGNSVEMLMLNEKILFELITILLWPICIPMIFNGVIYCLTSPDARHYVVLLFTLISVVGIVLVSGQQRHSVCFIVFYPFFMACPSRVSRLDKGLICLATIGVLCALNTREWMNS